ncbi:MAG: ribonuclease HII, partial [Gammaproteobacteria bacterium]|nr:ribonuclease HII [Gammaproteobacteria bacterium]
ARCLCVARASVEEIDRVNILQASLIAMERAVQGLEIQPEFVYVDGNQLPKWRYSAQAVVKGDSRLAEIAAASIVAKVTRDTEMIALEKSYPGYGFAQHKGYPTTAHLAALKELGPCVLHRRSFAPVAEFFK